MKSLMLGAALLTGAACGQAPAAVRVGATTVPEPSTSTSTEAPATTTTEPEPATTTTEAPVAPVTTKRTTTTVYEPPAPQGRTTGRGSEPPAGDVLACIRSYEGDYGTNTGNGYYGAYQFDLTTWASVGGSGLPSNASPAEQDMRAGMLIDRRGLAPWPTPSVRCQ